MFEDLSKRDNSGVTAISMARKEKEAAEENVYVDSPSSKFADEPVVLANAGFDHDDSD